MTYRIMIHIEPFDRNQRVWSRTIDDAQVQVVIDAINRVLAEDELRRTNNTGSGE